MICTIFIKNIGMKNFLALEQSFNTFKHIPDIYIVPNVLKMSSQDIRYHNVVKC